MTGFRRLLVSVFLLFSSVAVSAEPVSVNHLRVWRAPDHTRVVFDISGPLEHRLFTLENPHRVVVDMDNARLLGPLPEVETGAPLLSSVRSGMPDEGPLRIVLDLKAEARARSFMLKPAGPYGHRLVIDLHDITSSQDEPSSPRDIAKSSPPARSVARDRVVAIDAGHGGEDPGAVGRRYRTREKDVTLAIARELARLVAQTPGMRPVLIRDGDYYVGLRQRYEKARRLRADVFISIHADAVPSRRAYGSSVYALSEKGASNAMARQLADKENSSDLIGGVSLNDKDDMLAQVLLDLSHNKTMQDSLGLGEDILVELQRVGPVHMRNVAQAGFAVLKSPDIPSVLVETAFISNPSEEKKLRTPDFQNKLATSLFRGIQRFLARVPQTSPAPVQAAVNPAVPAREHIVRRGDTLVSIARKYDIHVDALRFINDLQDADLPVGLRLRIPARQGDG
ncbi:MAG: N-acetylmuramoyl-L-alanine amidase [Gammaproteobacteria bacterium]|nr:N-acetylmuramoyl-L-alanine amidase [Gammaproteobacteria bacterium]MDH5513297.1 N-acetylmuramoyl-L-alanine amidase [Gammaproteobacteria bacterium]